MVSNHTSLAGYFKRHLVFIFLLVFLVFFSASNKIGFAKWEVEYPITDFMERLAGIFRSSGRMFWPVFLLNYIFGYFYCG